MHSNGEGITAIRARHGGTNPGYKCTQPIAYCINVYERLEVVDLRECRVTASFVALPFDRSNTGDQSRPCDRSAAYQALGFSSFIGAFLRQFTCGTEPQPANVRASLGRPRGWLYMPGTPALISINVTSHYLSSMRRNLLRLCPCVGPSASKGACRLRTVLTPLHRSSVHPKQHRPHAVPYSNDLVFKRVPREYGLRPRAPCPVHAPQRRPTCVRWPHVSVCSHLPPRSIIQIN